MNDDEEQPEEESGRWELIRDVAVFQVKLLLDGFRDLLLVPVSLVTGLISLLNFRKDQGAAFYDLLSVGRRSEQWINLFGAADRKPGPGLDLGNVDAMDMDEVVSRVETFIVDEYRKGGVTAQAKRRLDKALDSLSNLADRNPPDKES